MPNEYPALSINEKLKLFGLSLVLAQLHPLQLFSVFLFTILTTVLDMHFQNIGYEFYSGWPLIICWAIGYLLFNSFLYSRMTINEVKYLQSRLLEIGKLGLYTPDLILGQILKANTRYFFNVAFWPLMIVIFVLFPGPGGEELNMLIWIPMLYLVMGSTSFFLSFSKKKQLSKHFGLS